MESNQTSVSSSNRSIDQVLEKIRRGMRAARIGGWVDGNDSGSEIENPSSPAFGLIATAGTTTGTTGTSSTDLYHQNNPLNHRHQRPVIHSSSPSSQPQSALGNGRLSAHNQSIASSASDGGHPNLHLQPHHWRNRANHHHQAIISEDPSPETHKLPINPSVQRHPLPQPKPRIYNRLSDGEDDPQAFLAQSAQSSDSRSVAHPSTSALVVDLPRSASADLSSLSILHPHPHPHPQLLSLSPGFGTPTSAHDPHMPLTPCSGIYPLPTFKTTGGSLGSSPYVRHHFKWEFLENPISVSSLDSSSQSNNPQPPQPRFLESSSSSTTTQTHFETSSSNVESDSPSTRDVPTKIFNRQSWKDNSSQSSTGMNTTTTRNPINSSISSSPSSSSSQSYSSSDLSQSDFKINSSNILLSSHSSPSPSPSPNPTHNSIVHQTSQLSKGSDPHPSFNQIKLNPFTTSAQLSSGTCLSSSTDSPSQFRWRSPSDSERGHLLLTLVSHPPSWPVD
ncbi:hypothetical protein BY996DRAFT_6410995 [Phakopsora pachyrhizi]|nr:hypothetical protein BY996DRAFT_6410995 [Phakopsora pachyrhizi]